MTSQFYNEYDINGIIHNICAIPSEFLELIEDVEAGQLFKSPGKPFTLVYENDRGESISKTFYAISRPSNANADERPTEATTNLHFIAPHWVDFYSEEAFLGKGSGGACYEIAVSIGRNEKNIFIKVPSKEEQAPVLLESSDQDFQNEYNLWKITTSIAWATKLVYNIQDAEAEHTALMKLHDNGQGQHVKVKHGLGIFKESNNSYQASIIMEAGEMNLHTLLQRNRDGYYKERDAYYLTMEKRVQIMLELDALMCDIEQQGIRHSDIKPKNIIVKRTGKNNEKLTVKFIDFHLAGANSEKSTEGIYGTPGYISRSLHIEETFSQASETYAFAMTCLELFCATNESYQPLEQYFTKSKMLGLGAYLSLPEITSSMFDLGSAIANDNFAMTINGMLQSDPKKTLTRESAIKIVRAIFQLEANEIVLDESINQSGSSSESNSDNEPKQADEEKLQPEAAIRYINALFKPENGIRDQRYNLFGFLNLDNTNVTLKNSINYRFETIVQLAKIIELMHKNDLIIENMSLNNFRVFVYTNNSIQTILAPRAKMAICEAEQRQKNIKKYLSMLGMWLSNIFPGEIKILPLYDLVKVSSSPKFPDEVASGMAFLLSNLLNFKCELQLSNDFMVIEPEKKKLEALDSGEIYQPLSMLYQTWLNTQKPDLIALEQYVKSKEKSLLSFLNGKEKNYIKFDEIQGKIYFFLKRNSSKKGKYRGQPRLEIYNDENGCNYASPTRVQEIIGMVVAAENDPAQVTLKQKPADKQRVVKLSDSANEARCEYEFQKLAGDPLAVKPPIDVSLQQAPGLTAVVMRKAGKYSLQEFEEKNMRHIFCEQSPYFLTEKVALNLSIAILRAIQNQAHDNNLVHRDIKPANIMITAQPDGTFQVNIIDWELAKKRGGFDSWTPGGTRGFIAPEVLAFKGTTIKSDIYAAGLIVGSLLKPFAELLSLDLKQHIANMAHDDPVYRPELRNVITLLEQRLQHVVDVHSQPSSMRR
jgi:serine/threonine protein kinase